MIFFYGDENVTFEKISFVLDTFYCKFFSLKAKTVANKQLSKHLLTAKVKQLIDRKSPYFELYRLSVITHADNNSFKNIISSKIKRTIGDHYIRSF